LGSDSDSLSSVILPMGCVPALCHALRSANTKLLLAVLGALHTVLTACGVSRTGDTLSERTGFDAVFVRQAMQACGGLETLESLQSHPNGEVYGRAVSILDEFIDEDDGDFAENEVSPADF